ncbi:MAG: nucleotidyltransferase domain-containing protein [Nautiliaceae bacterium]|jgi:predicted nucleotidyltransferase
MTKKEILTFLKSHKNEIYKKFKAKKIGLFGFFAKNENNKKSDIDIYVEFEEKSFDNLVGLYEYLENNFHQRVDIYYPHKFSNKRVLEKIKKEVIYG